MSKQITSTSRLVNQLERILRALLRDFFEDAMPMPVVTCTPTAKAYAHYTVEPVWNVKGSELKHEINISSEYLSRPFECVVASALHELVHYYCGTVLHVRDTSNQGVYHNKVFKREAEAHGLICTKTKRYGFSDTSTVLSDTLLEWVLLHDEFREIELYRSVPERVGAGAIPARKSSTRKYVCPHCGQSVRATKTANILCGDCNVKMIEP